jgi:hypothetical protein
MDIEVRGGSKPLWVSEFGCYLPDGGMAFSYEQYPERPQSSWLRVPEGSQLRESRNSKNPESPITESRSICANAAQVLGFYRDCADRGDLVQVESPVVDTRLQMTQLSRTEPGFFAENEVYYFSVEIFQHKEVTFWTVKHGQKLLPAFRSKREPAYLLFMREENGRVIPTQPRHRRRVLAARRSHHRLQASFCAWNKTRAGKRSTHPLGPNALLDAVRPSKQYRWKCSDNSSYYARGSRAPTNEICGLSA